MLEEQKPKGAMVYWANEGLHGYTVLYIDSIKILDRQVPLYTPVMVVDEDILERMKAEFGINGGELIYAGRINPLNEPKRIYEAINDYLRRKFSGEYERTVDTSTVDFSYLTKEECLKYLSGLTGRIREVLDDRELRDDINHQMRAVGRNPALRGYEINELILAASSPTEEGRRLTEMYLGKFFAIAREDYEKAASLQKEIKGIRNSTPL